MAENGHNNGDYQLITPPNLLKAKVGGGGGGARGIDVDAVHQASSAIASMADDFADRVSPEIAMMTKLSHDLEDDPSRAEKIGFKICKVAREVGDQGETFGFDLISEVGGSLINYISNLREAEHLNGEVVRAHTDAMRAVIKNKVKGDGGPVGVELVESLNKLVKRMSG